MHTHMRVSIRPWATPQILELYFCLLSWRGSGIVNLFVCSQFFGILSFMQALQNMTQLTSLHLSNNRVDYGAAVVLANALKCTTQLTSLDLRNNDIGGYTAVRSVAAAAAHTCLYGTAALAEALKHTTQLVELRLSSNQIRAAGAEVLAEALPASLVTLDLARNGIGRRGAAAVAVPMRGCDQV